MLSAILNLVCPIYRRLWNALTEHNRYPHVSPTRATHFPRNHHILESLLPPPPIYIYHHRPALATVIILFSCLLTFKIKIPPVQFFTWTMSPPHFSGELRIFAKVIKVCRLANPSHTLGGYLFFYYIVNFIIFCYHLLFH